MALSVYHHIDLDMINLGFNLRSDQRRRPEIREVILQEYDHMGIRAATAEKRWTLVAAPVFAENPVSEHVIRFWSESDEGERRELCLCACLAAFPILNEVDDGIMQISGMRESASQKEIRQRLSKIHGGRPSLSQAIRKCIHSLLSWDIIRSPEKGVYVPRDPVLCNSVIGSAAIASQLIGQLQDGKRVEGITSRSPLSLWDFSSYAPGVGHCVDFRIAAHGREYVLSKS